MNIGAKIIVSAAFLALSAPAFAHGMGGHFFGMGGAGDHVGDMSHQTMTVDHDGDHQNVENWQDKTSKTIDKTNTSRLKTVKIREVLRIEREIRRLRFELVRLRLEGRSESVEARLLRFQVEALDKQLAVRNS